MTKEEKKEWCLGRNEGIAIKKNTLKGNRALTGGWRERETEVAKRGKHYGGGRSLTRRRPWQAVRKNTATNKKGDDEGMEEGCARNGGGRGEKRRHETAMSV